MNNLIIYDDQRQPRRLGEQIGSGGQGDVYALAENPNIVVKIFNQEKLQERRHELREKVFVQIRVLEDLIKSPYVTWPQIEIFDSNDQWMGYAMKKESQTFFDHILRENLNVIEFLNADYSFLNEKLARFYGIQGVKGEKYQKVSLQGSFFYFLNLLLHSTKSAALFPSYLSRNISSLFGD